MPSERVKPRASAPSRRLFALITLASTIVVVASLGEIAARLVVGEQPWPALPTGVESVDPGIENPFIVHRRPFVYFHLPGASYDVARAGFRVHYDINARGFRGPLPAPAGGRRRVVIVGDSIIEGHGVELPQSLPALLDAALGPAGLQVVNAGVQGASPLYYAANVRRYLALEPDAIVLFLFDNDLYEDRHRELRYFGHRPILDEAALIEGRGRVADLPLGSRLLALPGDWLRGDTPLEADIRRNRDARRTVDEQARYDEISRYVIAPSNFDDEFAATRVYLDHFADALDATATRLLVVDLSFGFLAPGRDPVLRAQAERTAASVAAWAASRGAAFFSLLPAVDALWVSWEPDAILIAGDGHPTIATQQALADALAPWLEAELAGGD